MKFLIQYLKPHKYKMALGLIIKFTGTYMDLLIPMMLAHIIDDIVPLKSTRDILWWGLLMILAAVTALIFNITANCMASKVAMLVSEDLRGDTFRKVLNLSCSQLDDISIPSAISRLTSDTYELHNFIGLAQRMGVRAPFLLIVGLIISFYLDWRLALVLFSVVPILGGIIFFVYSKGIPLFRESRRAGDEMVRSVRENITGARVIKALSKKDYENSKFQKVNSYVKDKNYHAELNVCNKSHHELVFKYRYGYGAFIRCIFSPCRKEYSRLHNSIFKLFHNYIECAFGHYKNICKIFKGISCRCQNKGNFRQAATDYKRGN